MKSLQDPGRPRLNEIDVGDEVGERKAVTVQGFVPSTVKKAIWGNLWLSKKEGGEGHSFPIPRNESLSRSRLGLEREMFTRNIQGLCRGGGDRLKKCQKILTYVFFMIMIILN